MSSRSLCAFLLLTPIVLVGGGACGGSAFESAGGSGGSSAVAGSGTGAVSGSFGVAGTGSSAGTTSVGGSSSTGGTTSSAGATSTAGTTSVGGTSSAGTGGIDMTVCSTNSECQLEPVSCCSCGGGAVSDYTAINSKYTDLYGQRCGAVDCAGCPPVAYDPNNPSFYYVPTCASGHCKVVDLKSTPITACSTTNDCIVRDGTACCPSCSGGTLVTINGQQESALEGLVCSGVSACPACANPYIPAGSVACEAGRCIMQTGGCTESNPCPI